MNPQSSKLIPISQEIEKILVKLGLNIFLLRKQGTHHTVVMSALVQHYRYVRKKITIVLRGPRKSRVAAASGCARYTRAFCATWHQFLRSTL